MDDYGRDYSLGDIAQLVKGHLGRLGMHKETQALHDEFAPLVADYLQHWGPYREAEEQLELLSGAVDFALSKFEHAVEELRSEVKVAANLDEKSALYLAFLSPDVYLAAESDAEWARRMVGRVLEASQVYPDAVPKDVVDLVRATGDELMAAQRAVDAQTAVVSTYEGNAERAREPLMKAYHGNATKIRGLVRGSRGIADTFYIALERDMY